MECHPIARGRSLCCTRLANAALAARLAEVHQARFVYDSREYGVAEFSFQRSWRWVYPRYVHGIESAILPQAAATYTVCDGISVLLQNDLSLTERPTVVRNVPPYQPVAPELAMRGSQEPLRVLYHGLISPGRGLEELVQSLPMWRSGRRLAIRGPHNNSFGQELIARARRLGVMDRVDFLEPVATNGLISAAAAHDIGVFAPPSSTDHFRFTLPNKFFEYVMAGLALAVADLPEMSPLVQRFSMGRLIPESRPEAIASVINSFDPAEVDEFRRASRQTARELNWESESPKLIELVHRALEA